MADIALNNTASRGPALNDKVAGQAVSADRVLADLQAKAPESFSAISMSRLLSRPQPRSSRLAEPPTRCDSTQQHRPTTWP